MGEGRPARSLVQDPGERGWWLGPRLWQWGQKRPEGGFRRNEQALGRVEQDRATVMSEFKCLVKRNKLERLWLKLRSIEQTFRAERPSRSLKSKPSFGVTSPTWN